MTGPRISVAFPTAVASGATFRSAVLLAMYLPLQLISHFHQIHVLLRMQGVSFSGSDITEVGSFGAFRDLHTFLIIMKSSLALLSPYSHSFFPPNYLFY